MPEISAARLALGLVAGAVVTLAVVAVPAPPAAAPPALAPGPEPALALAAEVELPRLVRDPRTIAVLVTNHGTGPVFVREVELLTESFAPTGPVEKSVPILPGAAKALAVVYGEGRCGGEAAPPLAPTTARLVVAAGDQPPAGDRWQTIVLPLAHADERLGLRLHADCAAQLAAAVLDIRVADWTPGPDGRLRGTLAVERRTGEEPVTVHNLVGSTLYALAVDRPGGEIGRLAPEQDRLAVPVIADAARCDPHGLADVKFPFRFRIWVTVGDAAELSTTASFDPADQARFDEMWHVRCR